MTARYYLAYDPETGVGMSCAATSAPVVLRPGLVEVPDRIADPASVHVVDGQAVPRPVPDVAHQVEGGTVTISELPAGTVVECAGDVLIMPEADTLEIDLPTGMTHEIVLRPPAPYLPVVLEVTL